MANNYENITIPTGGTTDVCLAQNVLTNAFLILNGINAGNFDAAQDDITTVMRNISITCASDLSAQYFIIIGEQNGQAITETLYGPDNGTVYSVNYYSSITSIQSSAGATSVSVGSGNLTRVFYNAGASFSGSRFMDPYIVLTIDNPGGPIDPTYTQVDGITYFPANLLEWTPEDTQFGTRSIKASDTSTQYQMTKEVLQLYQGFAVTVTGFPSESVFINIVQP